MRQLPLCFFALVAALSVAEQSAQPVYPLWDGTESVAEYATRVNLPPTKTLDLGDGVKMELVLIPAGKFIMGTPEPEPVDEEGFRKKILTGQALLALGGGVLLVLLGTVVVQAFRKRQRPKFSLARLLVMTTAASVAVLSGMHWQQSEKGLEVARAEYAAAKARYDVASPDEKPAHPVTLAKPFYMGTFTVTQEQYQAVIINPFFVGKVQSKQQPWFPVKDLNHSHFKGKDNPVDTVSWDDAQAFCKKLAEQTQQAVRLPSEAEWEYACRAGTTTTYYSGDTDKDLDRVAWYAANSKNTTHPVGQKEANVFGLYDMHGNVGQWCEDWSGSAYYGNSEPENPQGLAEGACHVLRGGFWGSAPGLCRSAYRVAVSRDSRQSCIGFRVVVPAFRTP